MSKKLDIPWFGTALTVMALAFASFIGYLVYDEIRGDREFRERCEARGGIVLTESGDTVRVCVTVDDERRQVIIDLER